MTKYNWEKDFKNICGIKYESVKAQARIKEHIEKLETLAFAVKYNIESDPDLFTNAAVWEALVQLGLKPDL